MCSVQSMRFVAPRPCRSVTAPIELAQLKSLVAMSPVYADGEPEMIAQPNANIPGELLKGGWASQSGQKLASGLSFDVTTE